MSIATFFLTQDTISSTCNNKKKKKRRKKTKVLFYRWPVSHNVVFIGTPHITIKLLKYSTKNDKNLIFKNQIN